MINYNLQIMALVRKVEKFYYYFTIIFTEQIIGTSDIFLFYLPIFLRQKIWICETMFN